MFIANRQKWVQLLIASYTVLSLLPGKHRGVLFFTREKKNKACFLGWQEGIFSFKILIMNFDGLLKKTRNVDLE